MKTSYECLRTQLRNEGAQFHLEFCPELFQSRPTLRKRLISGVAALALVVAAISTMRNPAVAMGAEMYLGAATAWAFYYTAKKYLGTGDIDLDNDSFRMALFTSASNALSSANLSVLGSVTNQIADGNGYSTSGKALSTLWSTGASASEYRWNADAVIWSASGGNIANVRYAVIFEVGQGKLVCWSALSTAQFTVNDGNTLTVTPSANGIFELN